MIYLFIFLLKLKALLEFSFPGVFAVFFPQKLCGNISVFPTTPSNSK